MPFKKGLSGNPKGKPKGCKNKPKPLAARLSEIFGEVNEKDLKELVQIALTHAKGDTIVTESADGQKLSAKCVSDPRLFGIISKTVTDHEAKTQTQRDLPPILAGLRQELESYSKPSDETDIPTTT